jgi:hypothetical protein
MSFGLSHTYAQGGEYTVTVTDDVGAEGSASAKVVVNNVPQSVNGGPDARILEGGMFERDGFFTDPGADFWTATVDYGDGDGPQALDLSGMTFHLSHTYVGHESGPFTVTVTVKDDDESGIAQALVTVVYPLTIDLATVKLERRRRWRRHGRDTYDVDGRLPLSLLERLDSGDAVTIEFAGLVLEIPAGGLVRRDQKWCYNAGWQRSGIKKFELRDDGRFKIQATGLDMREVDFSGPVPFSLFIGTDIGKATIQLDRRLHFRSHRVHHDDDDDDDDHIKRSLKRFFRRGR